MKFITDFILCLIVVAVASGAVLAIVAFLKWVFAVMLDAYIPGSSIFVFQAARAILAV